MNSITIGCVCPAFSVCLSGQLHCAVGTLHCEALHLSQDNFIHLCPTDEVWLGAEMKFSPVGRKMKLCPLDINEKSKSEDLDFW